MNETHPFQLSALGSFWAFPLKTLIIPWSRAFLNELTLIRLVKDLLRVFHSYLSDKEILSFRSRNLRALIAKGKSFTLSPPVYEYFTLWQSSPQKLLLFTWSNSLSAPLNRPLRTPSNSLHYLQDNLPKLFVRNPRGWNWDVVQHKNVVWTEIPEFLSFQIIYIYCLLICSACSVRLSFSIPFP